MLRRDLLARGAVMVAGGGLPAPRPDQRLLGVSRAGSGPAPQNQFLVNPVIVVTPGRGLFVYSPSPGPGNLIASVAASGGLDPYGNEYEAGFATYENSPVTRSIQILASLINFHGSNEDQVPADIQYYGTTGILAIEATSGAAQVAIDNGSNADQGMLFDPATVQFLFSPHIISVGFETSALVEIQGTAAVELLEVILSGAVETWHTFSSLENSWTGTLRYRLRAENEVSLQADSLTAGTLASGTVLATLPAGYRPASEQRLNVTTAASGALGDDIPALLIETNGDIEIAGFSANTTAASVNGRFPLD